MKGKISIREFAAHAGISKSLWGKVLKGVCNLGESNSDNVARITRTKAVLWRNKSMAHERPDAWLKIKRGRLK
jgi:hypothetical protein